MSNKGYRAESSSSRVFDFLQKFNRLVMANEELARQLPTHEFELNFDEAGSIYIDGKPLGVNVNRQLHASRPRGSRRSYPKSSSERISVKVAAWNNGTYNPTGAGYGLRLDVADRDTIFNRSWSDVVFDLPNGTAGVRIKLSPAFWRDCAEFRSAEIGKWLIGAGYGRWRRGSPPTFTLVQVSGNHFSVI